MKKTEVKNTVLPPRNAEVCTAHTENRHGLGLSHNVAIIQHLYSSSEV